MNADRTRDHWEFKLASLCARVADHRMRLAEWREERDRVLREAHAAGLTTYALSSMTGLSQAQVQRICDLSKEPAK